MEGDWVTFAAYAVILIVVGMVSVVKKIAEIQRRRKEEAKKRQQRKFISKKDTRGLQIERKEKKEPVAEPLVLEEEPETKEPDIDLEDIMRRALGMPVSKSEEKKKHEQRLARARRSIKKPKVEPVIVEKEVKGRDVLDSTDYFKHKPIGVNNYNIKATASGWSGFTDNLKNSHPSELARAIIVSELIQPPVAFRRSRNSFRRVS